VDEDGRWLVALNLGGAEARLAVPGTAGRIELSTVAGRNGERVGGEIVLRPDEGLVIELQD
jgi:alpha-glucosidase